MARVNMRKNDIILALAGGGDTDLHSHAGTALAELMEAAPVNAVASSLTTELTGANNDMTFTAKVKGAAGDDITIQYEAPTANGQELSVKVTGKAIKVKLAGTAAAAAAGTITIAAGNVQANDTVTIGDTTYKFVVSLSEPAEANEVKIGNDAAGSAANLVAAINAGTGAGNVYGTGTIANASVTAAAIEGVVTVTAKTKGVAGNAIAFTKTAVNITLDPTDNSLDGGVDASKTITSTAAAIKSAIEAEPTADALVAIANHAGNNGTGVVTAMAATALDKGVDGTAALGGTIVYYNKRLYLATADNTVADANWMRINSDMESY